MPKTNLNFEFIEKQIRKKSFGILGTVDQEGNSHSTAILYVVAPPTSTFSLYLLTRSSYKKVKNIKINPSVSFVIPFPHHVFRFVPASCIQFQGIAELLPIDNIEARESFKKGSRILKMNLAQVSKLPNMENDAIFIKVIPKQTLFCYGLGYSLMELRKNFENGAYSVTIPFNKP